ncbi:DUF6777 domain-containing protein [Streptomyces sp. NPDC006551]|uniref:DUF6777 domain-containing protein n=1 Tax=Streptomyces sp. NPDC006551 TaxID=3157178 RepID=UPI0033B8E47A
MRSSIGRPRRPLATLVTLAALSSAPVLAGCSSGDGGDGGGGGGEQAAAASRQVLLQPVAARGPDPFTPSTARGAAPPTTPPDSSPPSAPAPEGPVREVTGSTPGLYGGTRSVASCDVERQAAFLTADPTKARAFAESAGIPDSGVADWLRGLTPVLLRADTRVTNHGYRDGRATAFQSVLQAGTAVLVDPYGAPRVRCACGNPLRSPAIDGGAVHSGRPWTGYRPDRVVVVKPTTTVVHSLVIVNVADDTWIERRTGSDGERDRAPAVVPPCEPEDCVTTPPDTSPSGTPTAPDGSVSPKTPPPDTPTTPGDTQSPGDGTGRSPDDPPSDVPPPSATDCPSAPTAPPTQIAPGEPDPYDTVPPNPEIPPDCPPLMPPEPPPPVDPEEPPLPEDLFPTETGPEQPDTFEG